MGADHQKFEAGRASFEGPRDVRRDTDGIPRANFEHVVIELDFAGALQNDVDLLGLSMPMRERRTLAGAEPEVAEPCPLRAQ
ncbi:MAG TPA: hypothetical protein VGH93_12165 [Solirubrobacteraceae bacterium]